MSPVDPIRGDCEGLPEVIIGATDREMSRLAALTLQTHRCSHKMYAFSPTALSKSRKQRYLASRHGHSVTRGLSSLWSSPPRLRCRYPGPGPSVARLSYPEPHLSRVLNPTPARDAMERARDCSRWTPSEAIARAYPEVIIGATDCEMSRPTVLMHQAHGSSHNM